MPLTFDLPYDELLTYQGRNPRPAVLMFHGYADNAGDWTSRHQQEQDIFTQLGYIDVQHFCPRIQAETFFTTCLMDKVCPPSTQFAAYNKITAKKSLQIYPDYEHETPSDHSDSIFNFLKQLDN